MKYGQIEANRRKLWRNQRVHILDSKGKTLCQTENMVRRKPFRLIEMDTPGNVLVCGLCSKLSQ